MRRFQTIAGSFARSDHGVTLVEYGIAIAIAIAVGSAALTGLGGEISTAMSAVGIQMPN